MAEKKSTKTTNKPPRVVNAKWAGRPMRPENPDVFPGVGEFDPKTGLLDAKKFAKWKADSTVVRQPTIIEVRFKDMNGFDSYAEYLSINTEGDDDTIREIAAFRRLSKTGTVTPVVKD